WYSTETRMYPLVVVLSLVGTTFAWKAFRDRSRRDAAFAVATYAALLYTHNWGIYLTVVTAAVFLSLALYRADGAMVKAVIAATILVFVLWLPWFPSFLSQASTTAAPWAVRPDISYFFSDTSKVFGGTLGAVVTPALVLAAWISRKERSRRDGHLAGFIGAIGILTALTGFLGAQLEPSWTVRYLAVIVASVLIAVAGSVAHSRKGISVVAAICAALAVWSAIGSLLPNPSARYAKSNAEQVAHRMSPLLEAGDLVVVTQTEQVSVLAHYLPQGLVYATPTGQVPDPTVRDWRNLISRLQQARFCEKVAPPVDAPPPAAPAP